ncbi:MAG: hypothetical protein ASARMPRED_009243 [Alectoria sarmentosa]|nr:MAG: hypothetical protein ASARMPRED_009243 [Alectoria sarmentosa]
MDHHQKASGGNHDLAHLLTILNGIWLTSTRLQNVGNLEDNVPTETLPGTEVMVDVGVYHFAKSERNNIVLVPQPSNDPNDPLNWSPLWKLSAITSATMVTFAQGLGPLAIAPIFPQLVEDFHSDLAGVVHFTGVTILVLGFSNFLWVPLRSYAWKAEASSYSSFMGAAVLTGIAAGPAEALQPTIIADVLFLHERGLYNTLYFVSFYSSIMIGPIIAGAMASRVGWRNFWWLNVAINTFVFFAVLLGFPETKWHRLYTNGINANIQVPGFPGHGSTIETQHDSPDTGSAGVAGGFAEKPKLTRTLDAVTDMHPGKSKPSKHQWKLLQPTKDPLKCLLVEFLLPWKLVLYPIVQFASFVVSFSSTSYLMITFVQSEALGGKPYRFDSQTVGFTNFASLVGTLLSLLTAGPASDIISATLTKRNNGIREPEMRLLAMVPYVLIMMLGNFVVGFGLQHSWDWRIIVIIGFTCAGIQIAALPSIAATYAIDSYKPASGAIFVSITANKNLWGYGVSQFITPWLRCDILDLGETFPEVDGKE